MKKNCAVVAIRQSGSYILFLILYSATPYIMKYLFYLLLLSLSLSAFPQTGTVEYSWDTITFESEYSYIRVGETEDNIWITGTPEKSFFDAPFNGDNAMVTGLSESYPANNHSYFDLQLGYFNIDHFPYSVYVEFNHKYDTDAGLDGGYIEVSWDNGISWENVIKNYHSCINPADQYRTKDLYGVEELLWNGEPGFSGRSGDWVNTKFGWEECLTKEGREASDTMILRFHFVSDSLDSEKEGWMIDDIRLYSTKITGSASGMKSRAFNVYPNPARDALYVNNRQNREIHRLSLYSVGGVTVFSNPDADRIEVHTFPPGFYYLRIETDQESVCLPVMIEE